jgi:hypothetical protein
VSSAANASYALLSNKWYGKAPVFCQALSSLFASFPKYGEDIEVSTGIIEMAVQRKVQP